MVRLSRDAFTLIELLIVIAIIGILMALLFPAVGNAIKMAQKTAAKNDVVQIANALSAYQTEYGQWPVTNETNGTMSANVLLTLIGDSASAAVTANPRRIIFMEVGDAKRGKSGKTAVGISVFVDPWGQPYQYAVDANYDNVLSNGVPGVTGSGLRKSVAVWSYGVPTAGSYAGTTGFKTNTNTTNFIKSWE